MTTLTVDESAVIRAISPNDDMMSRVYGESGYHYCGRSALECIAVSLQAAQKGPASVKRILDLPCGHGRVLRYLKAAFPGAEITACDLLRDGVDFCASTFGAVPVYSDDDPAKVPVERAAFDLIWVGSLFTHFDIDRWHAFLDFFRSLLCPGGVLVFTTHGREAYQRMVNGSFDHGVPYWRWTGIRYQYERTGFGYVHYLGSDSYGVSLSGPAWVFAQIARLPELRLACFSEKAWATIQDVYACVRDPDWLVQHPPVPTFTFLKHKVRELIRPRS